MLGFFDKYPYTDFHELNLDWLIKAVRELASEMKNFEALNTITYGGVWDITKQYSRWTIVTTSSGDGYISIEPVPAGIQVDNASYWMKLYDFVTALGALTSRVDNLENTVSTQGTTITGLQSAVTSLQNAINSLNTYKANRTRSAFADRNFLFVGDSYTNGGNVTKKWYETMCETINPGNYYVSTEGGEGFCSSAGKHYLDRIQDFIDSSTTEVQQSITDLFITGGYNDLLATVSDIQSANTNPYNMQKCVELCRQYFPNATIYIGMFARTALVRGNARHNIIYIERTATAYREGARWLGCKYITNSEIMLHDYRLFDQDDNVHPNQLGHNYLGHYVAQWFMNGSWSYNTNDDNNIRPLLLTHNAADCVEGHMTKLSPALGVNNIYEQLTDEGVIVKMLNLAGEVTDGGTTAFECAPATSSSTNTFNMGYFNPPNYRAYFSLLGSNNTFKIPGVAIIKDTNMDYHDVPCIITFSSNNEILINFQKMNGNNFQGYAGLNAMTNISGFEFVLPLHSC